MKTEVKPMTNAIPDAEESRRRLPMLCTEDERDIIERAVCLCRAFERDTGRRDPASDGRALAAICEGYLRFVRYQKIDGNTAPCDDAT